MGIELTWDDDNKTVLRCQFQDRWAWEDLYRIADEVKRITDATPYTVAAIIDLTKGMSIPGGNFFSPTALDNARRLLTLGEGGTGPIVIVGATSLIKMVYDMFKSMDRRAATADITFVDSIDQARQHLRRVHQVTPRPL